MYNQATLLYFRAVSPLHPGSGDGLGYIDRPIQRRSDNDHPKMEGSGIKGVLREAFRHKYPAEDKTDGKISAAFGPKKQDDSRKSAINTQDARILLFPVSSPVGNTLYLTCPSVLNQYKAEHNRNEGFAWDFDIPEIAASDHQTAYCEGGASNNTIQYKGKIMPHRMVLKAETFPEGAEDIPESLATALFPDKNSFYHKFYKHRIVLVHDDVFRFFVKYRTEVITGNKIDPKKGVVDSENGALFTFEYLPVGTVLYTWLEIGPEKREKGMSAGQIRDFMKAGLDQMPFLVMGGRTSVGKGEVAVTMSENSTSKSQPA